MLNLNFDKSTNNFNISLDNTMILKFNILDISSIKPIINEKTNTFIFQLNDQTTITIFNNIDNIEIVIVGNNQNKKEIKIQPQNIKYAEYDENQCRVLTTKETIYIDVIDGLITSIDETNNAINFQSFNGEMRIFFSLYADFKEKEKTNILNVSMLEIDMPTIFSTSNPFLYEVPIGQLIPEFSITLYDDSGRTIFRPLYNGVSILSTLPVIEPTNRSNADYFYYAMGKGPDSRTVYARAECNIALVVPSGFTAYMSSPDLYLKIFKISNGELLEKIALTKEDAKRYICEFNVNKSWGDNETILFEIFIKMKIHNYLPIKFSSTT
jgi:hypothetical protein